MSEQNPNTTKARTTEFIKTNTIKEYFKAIYEMRSTEDAVQEIITRFGVVIEKVLTESVESAKKEDRKTVLLSDVQIPIEKALGKKYLSWEDILKAILRQNPTNLANISKGIKDYIDKKEKKTIPINQKELADYLSKEFNLSKTNSQKIVKSLLAKVIVRSP